MLYPPVCQYAIGFCGVLTAGKSTAASAAEFLLRPFYNVHICSFGAEVKRIAREFGWDGKKDFRGRKLLQFIGTEVGREYDPDLWVKLVVKNLPNIFDPKQYEKNIVLFDDLRFENEATLIKQHEKGTIIRVIDDRPKEAEVIKHKSEKGIPEKYIDFEIIQDYDALMLIKGLHAILNAKGFITLKIKV